MTQFNAAKTLAFAVVTACALPIVTVTSVEAQQACSIYTVKVGDSLGEIANTAYGTFDYQQIFNANRNLITNPNDVSVGTVLQLPCADGSLPNAASSQDIIAAQQLEASGQTATTNAFEPAIKLVTGNDWAPFTGESLLGGGMFVRLASTALNRGGNAREYNMSYVDDWDAHLDTLLPLGAMDISIAWALPDCSKIDMLSERMARRCTELDASVPIYESVFGFYTLPDSEYAEARSFADLAGARICRPEGWLTFDLEQEGLVEPVVTLSQPKGTKSCLEQLINDEADVWTLDVETVAAVVAEAGMQEQIRQSAYLNSLVGMRFVTHKTNPRGRVYLAMLNRGIAEMRESGEWYAIIQSSLADFNDMN